ncbi:RNA exonuclease 4-like [Oratosquilla oratoria]|uniref:RNA exonuclease 4-like n=1 Tax=Oratosquilla oratoria TaxID=337810 RepID=UPI003F772D3C
MKVKKSKAKSYISSNGANADIKKFKMIDYKKKKMKIRKNADSVVSDDKSQPRKKGKLKKKKNDIEFKPTLLVKKPEDFSANWKQLQGILKESEGKKNNSKEEKRKKDIGIKEVKRKKEEAEVTDEPLKKKVMVKPDIWFDDVDPILLEGVVQENEEDSGVEEKVNTDKDGSTKSLVKQNSFLGVTKVIAMDCEMVGTGMNGEDSILARISIVNHFGNVIYDKYVKPSEKVTDYRTNISGIRPSDLENGELFSTVQEEVAALLKGRVLIGHALAHDLKVLYLSHPKHSIRDTALYKFFRSKFGGRTPSLKKLTEKLLQVKIQSGEHSSVQDAQAAMRLYTLYRQQWEKDLNQSKLHRRKGKGNKKSKWSDGTNKKTEM